MFDWLLLLSRSKAGEGGEVVYFGPVADLEEYLRRSGMGECPPDRNLVRAPTITAARCARCTHVG